MIANTKQQRFKIVTSGAIEPVYALILLFLTPLFLWIFKPIEMSHNSLVFVARAQAGLESSGFFYTPHLLQAPIISLFNSMLSAISVHDVILAGMLHSMLWAAIAIASIYLIARVVLGNAMGAIGVALLVLVAHGFWVYATQLEVYVPSIGCITAATALLFTNRSPVLGRVRLVAVSALWALATLYHTANVVYFIPLCVFFYGTQGLPGWKQLAATSLLAGGATLTAFLVVYWLVSDLSVAADGFLPWVLEIADRPLTDWGAVSNWWQPGSLVRAGWSLVKTLTLLPPALTLDTGPPLDQLPLGIVGAVVVVGALLWNVARVVSPRSPSGDRVYFLALFATYFLFFAWWIPNVHKFFVPSSIPLIMLIALAVRDLAARFRDRLGAGIITGLCAGMIALLFVFNLSSILELRKSPGPLYAEAEIIDNLAPANCNIYGVGNHLEPLNVYFGRKKRVYVPSFERDYFRFATGGRQPDGDRFEGEECAFVPLGFLSQQRYERRIAGYLHDGTWADYLAYVLEAKPSAAGGGITYNPFEVVTPAADPPNVIIDRRRRVEGRSLAELTGRIAAEVDRALAGFGPGCPTQRYAHTVLVVPSTDLEIGRERDLIFGYSWGGAARRDECR